MLPICLKPFEEILKAYQRNSIKIKAEPLEDSPIADTLGLKTSKFLGLPFLPEAREYPIDVNGAPMVLVAQINFSELPPLPDFPETGLFQLYLSPESWFDEESAVLYISEEEMKTSPRSDFSFLTTAAYEEIPVMKVHRLNFESARDYGGIQDCQFDMKFNDLEAWEFIETLDEKNEAEATKYLNAEGHKLGGYAEFTQSDPRGGKFREGDVQLLQIDVDNEIMFGDSGIGHVFISRANLQAKRFDKAYFYWDCC